MEDSRWIFYFLSCGSIAISGLFGGNVILTLLAIWFMQVAQYYQGELK